MARATGLEITETHVRAVELEGSPRKYRILGAANIPVGGTPGSPPGLDEKIAAVRQAMKAARSKRDQVVLGVPARHAVIREILIPFTDNEQIRKVIKFESETHLHGADIEDVVVGYHKIGEVGPRSRVLIIAVQKETLREYLQVLSRAGVDPVQIDLDAAALFSLSQLLPEFSSSDEDVDEEDEAPRRARIILDMGERTTTMMVTQGPHLRMVRCIRLGAESLTRALAQDLAIDREDAATVTHRLLGADDPFGQSEEQRAPSAALSMNDLQKDIIRDKENEFAVRLANEIRRSLSSLQLEGRLEGIWLTGPASTSPAVERVLSRDLGVSVETLDTLHNADHKLSSQAGLYVGPASGLALKALGHDRLRLDFRQEELRFTRKFEKIQTPLLFGALLLLALLGFLAIGEFKKLEETQRHEVFVGETAQQQFVNGIVQRSQGARRGYMGYENDEHVESTATRLKRQTGGPKVSALLSETRRIADHIEREYGLSVTGEDADSPETVYKSALWVLDQFMGVLSAAQDQIGPFRIDRLNVTDTRVDFQMRVAGDKLGTFDILRPGFEKIPGFESLKRGTSTVEGDYNKYENCAIILK